MPRPFFWAVMLWPYEAIGSNSGSGACVMYDGTGAPDSRAAIPMLSEGTSSIADEIGAEIGAGPFPEPLAITGIEPELPGLPLVYGFELAAGPPSQPFIVLASDDRSGPCAGTGGDADCSVDAGDGSAGRLPVDFLRFGSSSGLS